VLSTVVGIVTLIVSYAALPVAGVLLWRRFRSAATALVAFGFAAVFLQQLITVVLQLYALSGGDPFSLLPRPDLIAVFTFYGNLVGLWAVAGGLIWHTIQRR